MTPIAAQQRRLLIFTCVAHSVADAWHLLYPSMLFLIAADFNDDYLFLGLLANVMVACRGLSGVVAGFMADRYSLRLLFGSFGVLCCLGCLVVAVSEGNLQILLGLSVLGVGAGIYHPVGLSAITRNMTRRAAGLGIHGLVGAIGASALPVIAISVGVAHGWKVSFAIGAVVSISILPLLPLVSTGLDRPPSITPEPLAGVKARMRWAKVLLQRRMMALYGVAVLRGFALTGYLVFLTTAIAVNVGLGEERVAGVATTGLFTSLAIACAA